MMGTRRFWAVILPGALSLLFLSQGSASPYQAGQQFVLFDATFTFTKEDADNSKPSKSHYYVTGKAINPDRPRDWTSPVDYRNGTVHIRTEVLEMPESGEAVQWSLCYIPNKGQGNGYGCTGTDRYSKKGVYEKDVKMTSFWENEGIIWSEGIKQMDLVMKDKDGTKTHTLPNPEKFFPTRVRITMVQVAAGATYNPNLVPNIPRDKPTLAENSDKGTLMVIVKQADTSDPKDRGKPVPDALIRIDGPNLHRSRDIRTDSFGIGLFKDVPEGKYSVYFPSAMYELVPKPKDPEAPVAEVAIRRVETTTLTLTALKRTVIILGRGSVERGLSDEDKSTR